MSNQYFTKETESAIVAYNKETDSRIREKIYIEKIDSALDKLIEGVIFGYRFTGLSDLEELKHDCKTYLLTIMKNFDETKNKKAFSYFTKVTIHWFGNIAKKQKARMISQVDIGTQMQEKDHEFLSVVNNLEDVDYHNKKIDNTLRQLSISKGDLNQRDAVVLESCLILFEKKDDIEVFNKKAIYLYLREMTGLQSKDISASLKRIKSKYSDINFEWNNQ